MSDASSIPQPPQPPEFERRLQFHPLQLVGVPLLALLPILAAFGTFGTLRGEAGAETAVLELHVSYPTRFRYKTVEPLEVEVRNLSSEALPTVVVRLETDYLSAFSDVQITPSPSLVTEEVYEVALSEVQPGETRLVSLELQAQNYWRHRGTISVTAGSDAAEVEVASFVIP